MAGIKAIIQFHPIQRKYDDLGTQLKEVSPAEIGSEWISSMDVCAQVAAPTEAEFAEIPQHGVNTHQVIAYLDADESSKKNIVAN